MSKLRMVEQSPISAEISDYISRAKTPDQPVHRSVLRGMAGYAVGAFGLGLTTASIFAFPGAIASALVVGGLGSGLMWGSREIMRPNHVTKEADNAKGEEKIGKKVVRAGLFVGGLALSVTGFNFAFSGLFNSFERSISAGWRLASLIGGTALMGVGGTTTRVSYAPRLFGANAQASPTEVQPTPSVPPSSIAPLLEVMQSEADDDEDAEYYSDGPDGIIEMNDDLLADLREIRERPDHTQHAGEDTEEIRETIRYYSDLMRSHATA